jgi:hypothetical protein
VRVLVLALVVQLALAAGLVAVAVDGFPLIGGGGDGTATSGSAAPVPAARVDRFDAPAALALARTQVERYGQRPAGSPQLRRLALDLRRRLPAGRFEAVTGQPGLRDVVGTLPGRRPAIVVAAHYDTLAAPRGFVGANNGAAGTAVVVQLARDVARLRAARPPARPRELRFVLFDGEEPPTGLPGQHGDFYATGLRGSRAYAAAHRGEVGAVVVLDYVGHRGLRLPRERSSDPGLWGRVRAAAGAVGVGAAFPGATGPAIVDDHTPFLRAGVPAVDLIDWSYPGHALGDTLDRLSVRSLDAVGETLVELTRRLDNGRP